MERYVEQLIADLEEVAANPPPHPYYEVPPDIEIDVSVVELALVPFKPLREWSGINEEVFPEVWQLTGDQIVRINAAIFKVLDSLYIELIDKPASFPPELLYDALIKNWGMHVQYLPLSGMDMELCTYEIGTCWYGEYCEYCNRPETEEDDEMRIDDLISGFDDELPF